MDFHQQLRQQYHRFKQSQNTLVQKLQAEVVALEAYLRESLGLIGFYRKNISDKEAQAPYLRIDDMSILLENIALPVARFNVIVVLDEGEEIYPKEEISQLLELGYIQSDRMVLRFLPPTAASFPFNLGDNGKNKFEAFALALQQHLLYRLREQ